MNTVAQLAAEDRRALFTETGVAQGLPPFHVEKDYWVCWVLAALFGDSEIGPNLTFRGGTSLSKAWGLIERFSEDIDLAMSREWLGTTKDPGELGLSSTEKNRRLKILRQECRAVISQRLFPALVRATETLPEPSHLEIDSLAKARDPFCIHFEYPGTGLSPPANYHSASVKIELSGRADRWPMETRVVRPYVADTFARETGNPEIALSCVRPERTFWEKAALIHEQNMRPEERPLAPRQARHLSDLLRLWQADVVRVDGFASLFDGVKAHRRAYFDYTWVDYEMLTPRSLRLLPPPAMLASWRADYQAMRSMFYVDPIRFDELVPQLQLIEESLAQL